MFWVTWETGEWTLLDSSGFFFSQATVLVFYYSDGQLRSARARTDNSAPSFGIGERGTAGRLIAAKPGTLNHLLPAAPLFR